MKFIQVIEKIGEDVVHVVEFPFTMGNKLQALIHTGQADLPALATAFDGLLKAGELVGADAAIEIAADGTNIPEYLVAAKDSVSFFKYFKGTFIPAIETLVKDVKDDLVKPAAAVTATTGDAGSATASAPAAPAPAPQPGPGLTEVVPQ